MENKGFGKEIMRFSTLAYPAFTKAYEICYPNGKKTINLSWLQKINSQFALAIWYMDDGGLSCRSTMTISTYKFSLEEHLLLQKWLAEKWNVKAKIKPDVQRKGYCLSFPAGEREKFLNLIKPYIIPSMYYKVDLPEVPTIKCPICGGEFIPKRKVYFTAITRKWNLYCSRKCSKYAHLRRRYNPQPQRCRICGRMFTPHTGHQVTCSKECSRLYHLQRKREWSRAYRARKKLKSSTLK
jgi:hypothetical protein